MKTLFRSFNLSRCCLCNGKTELTGEHKIKAAALKNEFGKQKLQLFRSDNSLEQGLFVQSTKSKHLKFEKSICGKCNSSRTQAADIEFDRFRGLVEEIWNKGNDPNAVFKQKRYTEHREAYLNVLRYFAKLLCCQAAAAQAPISKRVSRFAISTSDDNPMLVSIEKDCEYQQISRALGSCQYASHGGFLVFGYPTSKALHRLHSSFTIGPIQYAYWMHLEPTEETELKHLHPRFYNQCQEILESTDRPSSEVTERRVGFRRKF